MDAAHWLDAAHAARGLSDYRIAKELGVSRQYVSALRHGKLELSPRVAQWLGDVLGRDPGVIYAEAQAARAQNAQERQFWEHVARSIAALFIVAVLVPFPGSDAARADVTFDAGYTFHALLVVVLLSAGLARRAGAR